MKTLLTLALAGMLATTAAGTAHAGDRKFVVMHPEGTVRMKVRGDGINIDATLPIFKGRIELQSGPYDWNLGYKFTLTKLVLGVNPFVVHSNGWGQTRFDQVGIRLRDVVSWWAQPLSNLPTGGGAYAIDIPTDQPYELGDPLMLVTGLVTKNGSARHQEESDRPNKPITGVIDLDNGVIKMHIVLDASTPAPWWQPWSEGVTRTFTIDLVGQLPGPVKAQVDPEELPEPIRPILVPADPGIIW